MTDKIRWGIIGPGNIAKRFAGGLAVLDDATLQAVASRSQEKADAFADEFGAPTRYTSYQDLVADDDIDIIYIATVNPFHAEQMLLCLEAGKPVLCEKPFTINTAEAKKVVQVAREKKLFLMEGMWTRHFPLMHKLRQILADGVIGEVRMLNADFGFSGQVNPTSRLYDLNLGGGGMLDVGIYPLSLASMIFGKPEKLSSFADIGETGVDELSVLMMQYPAGEVAVVYSAIRASMPHDSMIMGRKGRIRIHSPWWMPTKMTITVNGKDDEVVEMPMEGTGFNYQIAEAGRCLREGKLESDVMPLDETISIMEMMDEARTQWGLKYPME
ncbi:MAG: Gfo/Idh/MocA family oxidoreductase [Chloroflexota bacterium]